MVRRSESRGTKVVNNRLRPLKGSQTGTIGSETVLGFKSSSSLVAGESGTEANGLFLWHLAAGTGCGPGCRPPHVRQLRIGSSVRLCRYSEAL